MTKEEILKYVMQSPENTNPNILRVMLNQLDNGGNDSGGFEFVTVDFNNNTSDTFKCYVDNGFLIDIPRSISDEGTGYINDQNFELNFDSTHETAQLNIPIIHSEEVTNILNIFWTNISYQPDIITFGGVIKDQENSYGVNFILNGSGSISFSIPSNDDDDDDGGGIK